MRLVFPDFFYDERARKPTNFSCGMQARYLLFSCHMYNQMARCLYAKKMDSYQQSRLYPKYRRKILVGRKEERLQELLLLKRQEVDIAIENIEIMPEHVHLFVKASPTDSAHWIVQQLKDTHRAF